MDLPGSVDAKRVMPQSLEKHLDDWSYSGYVSAKVEMKVVRDLW